MPYTTVIRLLGVVQNPANGFPARPLGMSALDGERYVKDPSDGKRPAVVIDEHSVICEWEPDMNHTDQIAKLLERL